MAETSVDDWTPFKVGKMSAKTTNWVEPACQSLASVYHVTHIHIALNVLRNGQIFPQLIYDNSRLNTDRILVIWLSPNDWRDGFRYGNVAFELEWSELIRSKRFYWIGVMNYRPQACRILITDQDRDSTLKRYDPSAGDGPWWYDESQDKHYWNGDYCLEFMFEAPISLTNVKSLGFVMHHLYQCSINPNSCPDLGHDKQLGGARLLAGACARRALRPLLWLKDDKSPSAALESAWNELRRRISRNDILKRGSVDCSELVAAPLGRSVMAAFSEWQKTDRRELLALFKSEMHAVDACAELVETTLDLASGTLARTDGDEAG